MKEPFIVTLGLATVTGTLSLRLKEMILFLRVRIVSLILSASILYKALAVRRKNIALIL